MGSFCETRLLSGMYAAEGTDDEGDRHTFRVRPLDVATVVTEVAFSELTQDGVEMESKLLTFDVASGVLAFPDGQRMQLRMSMDGRPFLEPCDGDAPKLIQVEELPLDSLKFPVHKDEALCTALKGHDLFSENFRDFTEAEVKHVFRSTRVSGEDAVLPQESPQALCLCAPSGCGKTSMMKTALDHFNMNTDEAVFADSGQFRDCHQQYKALVDNGIANDGIWYHAWPCAKGVVGKMKKRILAEAMASKRPVIFSDTGADLKKLLQILWQFRDADYTVHFLGMFADPKEIVARGIARELEDGKRYNRDMAKMSATFDSFAPAIKEVNGRYCLLRNRTGCSPELFSSGNGGEEVTFDVERTCSASPASTETNGGVVEVAPPG